MSTRDFLIGASQDAKESGAFHFTVRPDYEEAIHAQEREAFTHESFKEGVYATPGRGVSGEHQS